MGKRDSAHHGILAVDKPTGMTSTDVVRRVRHIMNTRRVGHTGTLDPDASGLLLVCVGEGTKAVQFLLEGTKTYVCEATLGAETQTDDAAGEVIRTADWDMVTRDALEARLSFFNGTIDQVPPRVSAIKKDGKRMYKRVLAGEDVDALLEAVLVLFRVGAQPEALWRASQEPGAEPLPSLHSSRFAPDPAPTLATALHATTRLSLSLLQVH